MSKPAKCKFLKESLDYLGHLVLHDGISPTAKKVEAIKQLEAPKSVTEVRQFLGMVGYYRKFIKYYAKLAEPLTTFTGTLVKFTYSDEEENSFQTLKSHLQWGLIIYTLTEANSR